MGNEEVEGNEGLKKYIERKKAVSWVTDSINIGGMELAKGDIIEVGVGRRSITAEFRGYDRLLYSFYLHDIESDEDIVIPYKVIKFIRKRKLIT